MSIQKEFIKTIIEDTIKTVDGLTAAEIAEMIYTALTNELEIYVLTKDYVGKLS